MVSTKKSKAAKHKKMGMKKEKLHQINPFELKINRQKHDILGRKVSKTEKGMPGVARSKAQKKRKETLLVEYKKLGRGNTVMDQRIGERDINMSYDEKMAKRFTLERQRELQNLRRKKLLTHDDDEDDNDSEEEVEELTHFGQSLSEMENFKDPVVSDADEDSDDGRITAKVVGEEHFGGFLTKRESSTAGESEKPKSWKEKMEEVIAKSKLAKLERQTEREKTLAAVKNVDSEWKELQMLVSAIQKNRETDAAVVKAKDGDYDVVMRQLQFDLKAKPSDRLKSEEDIAKEEKERLENLEADRVRRMLGHSDSGFKSALRKSADDLDDGFAFDSADGGLRTGDNEENPDATMENAESDSDEDDDDEDDEDGGDSDDSMSDIAPSDDESQDSDSPSSPAKKRVRFVDGDVSESTEPSVTPKLTQEEIDAAVKELPYTFPAPANYAQLCELLKGRSEEDRLTVIDRVIKCHHPSLAEGNKAKLEVICRLLLRYFVEVTGDVIVSRQLIDGLTRHIYGLTQMSSSAAGEELAAILFESHKQFFTGSKRNRKGNGFPRLNVLLVFKLVGVLFPSSDRRHPVVTPAMLYMGQILAECPINTTVDVAAGLLICTLFADYISLSKRYIPEVIGFLESVLAMTSGDVKEKVSTTSTCRAPNKHKDLLKLSAECRDAEVVEEMSISEVYFNKVEGDTSDKFKMQLIGQSIRLVTIFSDIYRDLPAFNEIFAGVRSCGGHLPIQKYPYALQMLHQQMMSEIASSCSYKPLARPASKPQPLKLLEPRIREGFDGRKKLSGTKAAKEKAALKIKTKREFKGAVREIRKDTQFLARQKLTDQMERDTERKRKVQKIISDLAQQEGDCRSYTKKTKS